MIILHMSGGLGNQMFQYAFGVAISKKLDVELKLDLSDKTLNIHNGFEIERIFDIDVIRATNRDIFRILNLARYDICRGLFKIIGLEKYLNKNVVTEPYFHYINLVGGINNNSYVKGYWQSERYFDCIADEIRAAYKFKLQMSDRNLSIANQMKNTNSVSLHVRRNDFANNSTINSTHGLCSLEYYRLAIKYISDIVTNPIFYIFSDDSIWVRSHLNLGYPCVFIDHNIGHESYNDMRLMSICRHNIIANSSFSWWGAWLNSNVNKIVVAPKQWFLNENNTEDLIPKEWVRL